MIYFKKFVITKLNFKMKNLGAAIIVSGLFFVAVVAGAIRYVYKKN